MIPNYSECRAQFCGNGILQTTLKLWISYAANFTVKKN